MEMTVGYSSSSEDEVDAGHVPHRDDLTHDVTATQHVGEDVLEDDLLIEPEFRGLWEAPLARELISNIRQEI